MKKVDIDSEILFVKPAIYKKSGKNVVVEFDKCFDEDKTNLNTFTITKSAYSKKLDEICRYCNVFFKYYDPDKEFITSLLIVKYNIDNINIYYSLRTFMSDIAELLLTDSIIKKIFKMVDDYYEIDLSPTDEIKNLDLHALQFMNEHGKALMALSIAYRLTIPVVCHYYALNAEKMNELNVARGEQPLSICHQASLTRTKYLKSIKFDLSYKIAADGNTFYKIWTRGLKFEYVSVCMANYEAVSGLSSTKFIQSFKERSRIIGRTWYNSLEWWIGYFKAFVKKQKRERLTNEQYEKQYFERISNKYC